MHSLAFLGSNQDGVYGCRIGYRILVQLCIGHTLRFMCYVSTAVPGARQHCQPGPEYITPPRGAEIFKYTSAIAPNCGDLIFSGHMFQGVTMLMAANQYLHAFVTLLSVRRSIVAGIVLVCLVQIYTIIASRSHYTVDIVIACYTAVLLWTVLWDRWPDSNNDLDNPDSMRENSASNDLDPQCDGHPPASPSVIARLRLIPVAAPENGDAAATSV